MVKITSLAVRSRAYRAGIRAGDTLVSIGGNEIRDVLDYRFYLAEEKVVLALTRPDGTAYEVTIRKGTYDDIGLEFETPLMDEKHSCRNKCIFCFIDQLPSGMRSSLYFKDDDSRLSFLHGNYITLTNLTDRDVDRIIKMRFSPINISIHTTNPELRVKMMKNKRAGEVLSYLTRIAEAGLTIHGQIVLCRGVNDGEELARSMRELAELAPALDSVSVVPAGMTAYREGLYPLTPFSREESAEVIRQVDAFAEQCLKKHGSRIFFCADEFYLAAELPLPTEEYYEGYPQIENGVGMLRSTEEEFLLALEDTEPDPDAPARTVTLATGVAAGGMMRRLAALAEARFPHLRVNVEVIPNDFFGHSITVSGLLTGRDMRAHLSGKPLGDAVIIPATALRAGEDVFLCDMTLGELAGSLGVAVIPASSDGWELLSAMLGE
jgi:putative radical SAM enzyme (TIGR03279 family)